MIHFLRFFFWPLLWLTVALFTTVVHARIWGILWTWFIGDPVSNTVLLVTLYFCWRLFKYWGRFAYALYNVKRLVALKVTLPRTDSKIDQEHRTEKDFKEKIAVMEQLYRALWEVRNLYFWQILHFWIFRYIILSFELYVEKGQLTFYVVTNPNLTSIVEKQITAFYPDAEVTPAKTPSISMPGTKLVGYNMVFKEKFMYPLRFYEDMQDDPLNGISNVLSKTADDEIAGMQVVLTPSFSNKWGKQAKKHATMMFKGKTDSWLGHIPIVSTLVKVFSSVATGTDGKTFAPGANEGDRYIRMIQPEEELYKRMGQKAGMNIYHASIRIAAAGKTFDRSMDITNNLQVACNAFKDLYGNYLQNKRMIVDFLPLRWNASLIRQMWNWRVSGYFSKECLLGEKELAGLYHFPDSRYNKMPIIQWSTYKVLPPPPNAPQEGIVLGVNQHRGTETPIRFLRSDRTRHHYIIGKSGSGKSTLLSYMSRQDIINKEGVCIVDPHGDLIEDALAHVPKERARDIVVFDPSDLERPMGLNLLEAKTDEEKDRASLDAMEIFIKLFGNEIFGPRIQHYFRNGCLTLMDDEEEGATLIDVPRLFVDDEFQRYKVSKCRNPVVRSFWEHEIAKTGAREKEEMIPYFSSKFGPFVTNTTMRNIIGQPKSAFNIRQIMDEGKVLLVNLSKGKIGDVNAQLLGLIFVNKINMAALSRASIPKDQRKRFYLYVDEFQNF
ncbi:MAG: DUF87 domain-containing protein, partial [Candidatus Peribacteraceae bacterium]